MSNSSTTVAHQIAEFGSAFVHRAEDNSRLLSWLWSLFTISRMLAILIIATNLKNFPLIWHLRIINAFRFICKTQRSKVSIGPEQLFLPIITTSYTPLMEIDFNGHKSNSTYFSDIDVARTHLVCTLFAKGISHFRGGTSVITPSDKPLFGLALGAVSCSFKRELKPYESYEIWSRILSWDEKWIYIVTHFVRKDTVKPRKYTLYPTQNRAAKGIQEKTSDASTKNLEASNIVATALSKCVFKSGRMTVSPALMLKESGLLTIGSEMTDKAVDDTSLPASCGSSDSGIEMGSEIGEQMLGRVERERQRGLKVAAGLESRSQTDLENEFTAEQEALGRHSDGSGITGVVTTLAELARIRGCKGIL